MDLGIYAEPKIDCHVHVLDPERFPYRPDTHYAPAGQEMGTVAQLEKVMQAYGAARALLVGPNSGYGLDNACLLDTLARGGARYKGVAVVENDASREELLTLKGQGVVGVAWNVTFYGVDYYRDAAPLLDKLAALDLFVDIQVEHDQAARLMPMLRGSGARVLVDHCGRPTVAEGLGQPGFKALLDLGATGRAWAKLSGLVKFSKRPPPHDDAWPFARALLDAYGLDHCLWASDWPYLRAPTRVDYGVLLQMLPLRFPDATERRKLLWDNPARLFGFSAVPAGA